MSTDDNRHPTCAKCGCKIIPPLQRAWGSTWYCTCPPEPTSPRDGNPGETVDPNKNP